MKKHLLLLSLVFIALIAFGQNSIPNGNFETWNSVTFDYPQNYPYNSNYDVLYRFHSTLPFNAVKTADAYHGSFAIELTTVASESDTTIGYFININPGDGDPSTWSGGMPYTEIPTGLRGYYKYNKANGDAGTLIAAFSKGGINIGTYFYSIGDLHTTYSEFSFTLDPPLAQAPDSVIFAAASSNIMLYDNGIAGSSLILDSVSFTGVSSQPAMMNGDFESWESQMLSIPANWIIENDYDPNSLGNRTTDAYKGEYAIELVTYLGTNRNNVPIARAERASTGYYPNNCDGNCNEMGGFPFTNQVDTLAFWYKYSPAATDTAQVSLTFKKNGIPMDWRGTNLLASANYKYVEIPCDLWQIPDTVIVNMQSSGWNDTLVSAVGSTLIIDEIHFKSQPILYTGLHGFEANDQLSVYPNPSDGKFRIQNSADIKQIIVYNTLGKQVYFKNNSNGDRLDEIDLTKFQKGVYFIEIYDHVKMHTRKIVIR